MFDDQEENQEQPKPSPARLRFSYWLAGIDPDSGMPPRTPLADRTQTWQELQARAPFNGQRMMQPDAESGQAGQQQPYGAKQTGMTPATRPVNGARSGPSFQREPRVAPKLSIGQRLMQMDLDAASGQRTGIAPKLTLGQRLMGLDGSGGFRVDNPQVRQQLSNRFSPASASPSRFESTNTRWLTDGHTAFARGQQPTSSPKPAGGPSIVDMTAQTKIPSRIPRPVAVPDVEPNLNLNLDVSDTKRQTNVLNRGFIFGDKVSPEFLVKVQRISSNLGIDPNWLMAVMDFETAGTLSPSKKNAAGSSGTGLIQLTKASGYDKQKLLKQKAEEQLDSVAGYLERYRGRLNNLTELYLSVLWPAALGKPDDYVLFKSPSIAYKQNGRVFDVTGKGYVTKGDVAAAMKKRYKAGLGRGTTKLMPDGSSLSRFGKKAFVQLPKRPSVLQRYVAGPEVEPDLSVNDPEQLRTTLNGLMRGIANSDRKGE